MALPRPIVIEYAGADKLAHATTAERAVRAAATRLIAGDYKAADVYRDGKLVASVRAMNYSITIQFYKRKWK